MAKYKVTLYGGTNFEDVIYPKTVPSQVEGLLGANNKINLSLLPIESRTGSELVGIINGDRDTASLYMELEAYAPGGVATSPIGKYFIVGTLQVKITASLDHKFINGDDGTGGGSSPSEFILESGDHIVYLGREPIINHHQWGIINNTYPDATSDIKGVVKIVKSTTLQSTSDVSAATPAFVKGITSPLEIKINTNISAISSITTNLTSVTNRVTTAENNIRNHVGGLKLVLKSDVISEPNAPGRIIAVYE